MVLASAAAVIGGAILARRQAATPAPTAELPAATSAAEPAATYVGRASCAACHPEQVRLFTGSHHDLAMQEADEGTVLGDFADASFERGGVKSRFYRRDGRFYALTDGPDGALHEYQILYTFGVFPLQQYLVAMPGGRLHALPIAWDSHPASAGGQRWYHLQPDEHITPDDELHWTQAGLRWNDHCARCHSTNLRKGYRADSDTYDTTWSEIDVSCEACHGPASRHVARARAGASGAALRDALTVKLEKHGAAAWVFDGANPIARRSAPRTSQAEIETCAPCHARRGELSAGAAPGRPLLDDYLPALLTEELYFPDGQIRDEVYEYGSFLQSAMFHAGVTCSDCHEPHSLKLRADGNAVCAQCHRPDAFDSPAHHLHPAGSAGAQCVACHMPTRTYMGVDARRDHGLRVPRPDLAEKLGTPDPCTGCHTDKTPRWAAEAIARLPNAHRGGTQQFAETIAAGRGGAVDGTAKLIALARDAGAAPIVRATAVSLLRGRQEPEVPAALRSAASDREPLLRLAAVEAAEGLDGGALAEVAAPRLSDPLRAVRMAAAHALASGDPSALDPQQREALVRGLDEYVHAQLENADRPESHANLGLLAARRGDTAAAERALETAIERGPHFLPAFVNLADFYRMQGRDAEGEQLLRTAIARSPQAAAAHHALGLLLVRSGKAAESMRELAEAAKLAPDDSRYAYVLAIGLNSTGQTAQALEVLRAAHDRRPSDHDVLLALITINRDGGDRNAALAYARELAGTAPWDPMGQRLIDQLAAPQ